MERYLSNKPDAKLNGAELSFWDISESLIVANRRY